MVASIESWHRILDVKGQIFKVTFLTKTPQRRMFADGTRTNEIVAGPGRVRTMICRRLVHKYTLGVISPETRMEEDWRANVLTVFDIQTFHLLRKHLEDQGIEWFAAMMQAGRRSYRRINMREVIEITGA